MRPIAEVFKEVGPMDKTWGSSSDWFIDLRDGHRLRIPMDLRVPVIDPAVESTQKLIQWVSSHRDGCESGCVEDDSIWGSDELEEGSKISGVKSECVLVEVEEGMEFEKSLVLVDGDEDAEMLQLESLRMEPEGTLTIEGGELVRSEELGPLLIKPLAVAIPQDTEVGSDQAPFSGRKPSDWVLRKEKGVGKVLEANYEGYE